MNFHHIRGELHNEEWEFISLVSNRFLIIFSFLFLFSSLPSFLLSSFFFLLSSYFMLLFRYLHKLRQSEVITGNMPRIESKNSRVGKN